MKSALGWSLTGTSNSPTPSLSFLYQTSPGQGKSLSNAEPPSMPRISGSLTASLPEKALRGARGSTDTNAWLARAAAADTPSDVVPLCQSDMPLQTINGEPTSMPPPPISGYAQDASELQIAAPGGRSPQSSSAPFGSMPSHSEYFTSYNHPNGPLQGIQTGFMNTGATTYNDGMYDFENHCSHLSRSLRESLSTDTLCTSSRSQRILHLQSC